MTIVWLAQATLFLFLSFVYLFFPAETYGFFHTVSIHEMRNTPALHAHAEALVATLRLLSPLALTLAMFSIHAAMRLDEQARVLLAGVFALWLGTSAGVAWIDAESAAMHTRHEFLLHQVMGAFALVNAVFALMPRHARSQRSLSGTANTRPPQLFMLWLAQGSVMLFLGAFIVYLPHAPWEVVEWLRSATFASAAQPLSDDLLACIPLGLRPESGVISFTAFDLLVDQLESMPPYLNGLAFASFYAMRVSREWVWRLVAGIFTILYATTLLTLLLIYNEDIMAAATGWGFGLSLVVLLVANQRFARKSADYFTRDVGQGPDGWTVTDLFAGPALALTTLLKGGRRPIHTAGVGVEGTFTGLPSEMPAHDLFRPDEIHELTVRYSNLSSVDDASTDVRGASVRIKPRVGRSLDFNFVTGSFAPWPNVAELFASSSRLVRWLRPPSEERARRMREAAIAGLRRAPHCFSELRYYTQSVRFWVTPHGKRSLVRFRLVPQDPTVQETGLLTHTDELAARKRAAGDNRAPDYLRRELRRRLEGGEPLQVRLEVQSHRPAPGDTLEWFDASIDWNETDHPWHSIGLLRLERPLTDEATELLCLDPENHPPSLGIPSSAGPWDVRSLADSERRVVGRIQRLRRWVHSSFGVPRRRTEDR